jgi:hypothetical protein
LVFDFATQKWSELTKLVLGYHSWSRDSRFVYFNSAGNEPAFYRLRIADRKLEKLVSLKGIRLASQFGWMALTLDDSPLVLRDVGTQEIYALDWQAP